MRPIKFGIIGCSSVARRRFVPALCASAGAQLERVGSRDAGKAEQFAREFGCAKWGSYDEVLDDPEVDAVYICTPPALHEASARVAVERGKHILCEKPAFPNLRIAEELVALCRERGVRLMEGYMFRYHPQHDIVRSLIDSGRIGEPRVFCGEFALPQPGDNNFRLQRELGGGIFLDAAGYPVAATTLLFKAMPASVYCRVEMDAATGLDTAVSMTLHFADGRIAHILAAYGLHYTSRYSVLGTHGRIETTRAYAVPADMAVEVLLATASGNEKISVPPADQFRPMIEDFCRQVRDTTSNQEPTFESTLLRQHAIMDAAWRSHLQQKPVAIS